MEFVGLSQKNIYLESMLKPYHTTMYRLNTVLKRFANIYTKKTMPGLHLPSELGLIIRRELLLINLMQRTSRKNIISYQHCLFSIG